MSLSIFLLSLVTIPLSLHAIPAPRGVLLNCGSTKDIVTTNLKFITDEGFISVGNSSTLKTPDLFPILSTLRYFPDKSAKKYCYVIPVIKGGKYLIRTTYYYGGFDGGNEPPVFEQIIDGTKWGIVNTTEDYAKGLTSYYEIVVAAMGKTLSVCLARNGKTVSSPFITALELENMEASVYNSTDFTKYALNVVARHSFGSNDDIVW
ncbi:Leucine-rich repeat receptor-like serine/threonine-protein kinase [Vitis vinifera]|uniref:Leucine-rich repeat receptor-like serine/threonine-protein kinase n=1 Tax=Vitis vinifera TaxID=29760 RepID=A0A438FMB2_VITVI|nr:Leucine-rich repeat receptor-like serine/threonine-protein kinase [Vitis vinifera]